MGERSQPSEAELEILQYVAARDAASVREVAEEFARTRGLARTTVLTLMERLRRKGHLTRRKVDGVFHYSAREGRMELLARLVGRFVERTLGGSLQPFLAYLTDRPEVTRQELEELKELVDKLDAKDRKEGQR